MLYAAIITGRLACLLAASGRRCWSTFYSSPTRTYSAQSDFLFRLLTCLDARPSRSRKKAYWQTNVADCSPKNHSLFFKKKAKPESICWINGCNGGLSTGNFWSERLLVCWHCQPASKFSLTVSWNLRNQRFCSSVRLQQVSWLLKRS